MNIPLQTLSSFQLSADHDEFGTGDCRDNSDGVNGIDCNVSSLYKTSHKHSLLHSFTLTNTLLFSLHTLSHTDSHIHTPRFFRTLTRHSSLRNVKVLSSRMQGQNNRRQLFN